MPKIRSIKQAQRGTSGSVQQRVLSVCYAAKLQMLLLQSNADPEASRSAAARAALQQSEIYRKKIAFYWDGAGAEE